MIIQWFLLCQRNVFKERASTMNDYKGSAMNDYTMVVVILAQCF